MRDVSGERSEIDRAIEGQTLCHAFAATVGKLGDAEALRDKTPGGEWRSLTWNQYRERVREAALGFHALGVLPKSFAVIMARNRSEYVIADLGLVHAGATPVGLYNTLAPEQVSYIANHCDARVAVVEDVAFLAKFQAVRAELPKLEHIVMLEGASDDPLVVTWDALLASGRPLPGLSFRRALVTCDARDAAVTAQAGRNTADATRPDATSHNVRDLGRAEVSRSLSATLPAAKAGETLALR
jgi:long-chain acyl-CoA synthetase